MTPLRRALSSAGAALLLLLSARIVLAACVNPCEASLSAAGIDPPLACASIDAKPQTCDCAIALRIGNGCAVPLEATDFAFDLCWSPNEPTFTREGTVASNKHADRESGQSSDRRCLARAPIQ